MAIDTEDKRRSVVNLNLIGVALPVPDGTVAAADRLHVCGNYKGIAAGAPPERTTLNSQQWGRVPQGSRLHWMKSASGKIRTGH